MIDIKLIRENPDFVKENIKKKFQDEKLPLVDEVRDLDEKYRAAKQHGDDLRAERNRVSKQIGALMREGKKEDAEACKQRVKDVDKELETLEVEENNMQEEIRKRMRRSLIRLFPSARTTVRMLSCRNSVSRLFRILRSRITRISWSLSMVWIWTVHVRRQATASTT